jgi:phosphoribosylformylglycinamidine cyclo-ligase
VLLIDALIAPTRIYVKIAAAADPHRPVHAMAHITGGGLLENIPRVLPEGLHAHIDADAWDAAAPDGVPAGAGPYRA